MEETRSTIRSVSIALICAAGVLFNVGTVQSTKIAIPSIGTSLGIPPANLQWIPSAYALANGCFYLLFARLGDFYGYKLMFLIGMSWMAIWNLGCGFAQNEVTIDLFRALEGMAPAAYIPAAIGIIAQCFSPGRPRRLAFSVYAAGAGAGSLVGNMFGGYLTQRTAPGWRTSFYVIAAMAAFTAVAAFFVIPGNLKTTSTDRRLDIPGVALGTSALVLIIFCLSSAGTAPKGWSTPYIIALIIIGIVLLGLFCAWEYRLERQPDATPPLMRLSLFKSRLFSLTMVQGFFVFGAFQAFLFEATLVLRNIQKLDPIGTTIRFIPTFSMGFLSAIVFALVVGRVRGQIIYLFSAVCVAIACLLFAVLPYDAIYWKLGFPSFVLAVLGCELMQTLGSLYLTLIANPKEQGMAAGIFYTIQSVGVSFALSIQSLVQTTTAKRHARSLGITPNPAGTNLGLPATIKGYRAAFWLIVAFALFAAVMSLGMYGLGVVGGSQGPAGVPAPEEKQDEEKAGADAASSHNDTKSVSNEKSSVAEAVAAVPELPSNKV